MSDWISQPCLRAATSYGFNWPWSCTPASTRSAKGVPASSVPRPTDRMAKRLETSDPPCSSQIAAERFSDDAIMVEVLQFCATVLQFSQTRLYGKVLLSIFDG